MKKISLLLVIVLMFSLVIPAGAAGQNYDLTFNAGDHGLIGGILQSYTYYHIEEGTVFSAPPVRANPGWVFVGWDTLLVNPPTANATYTAVYEEADPYIVTFYSGAHGLFTYHINDFVSYSGLDYGQTIQIPTLGYVEPGWVFTGWDKTVANPITGSEVYTAQYRPLEEYDITFNAGAYGLIGGSYPSYTYYDVEEGTTFSVPPVMPRAGWTFTGWDKTIVPATADVTYTAQYARNPSTQFSVTFYSGTHGTFDHRINDYVTINNLSYGDTITVPSGPYAEDGWIFTGWDKTVVNPVTGAETYTAQYRQAQYYDITFSAGDHGLIGGVYPSYTYYNIIEGTPIGAPPVTANSGWTFVGWDKTIVPVSGDETYTAVYAPA